MYYAQVNDERAIFAKYPEYNQFMIEFPNLIGGPVSVMLARSDCQQPTTFIPVQHLSNPSVAHRLKVLEVTGVIRAERNLPAESITPATREFSINLSRLSRLPS